MSEVPSFEEFSKNMSELAQQYQVMVQEVLQKQNANDNVGIWDPTHTQRMLMDMGVELTKEPNRLWQCYVDYSNQYLQLVHHTIDRFMGNFSSPLYEPDPHDKRFKDEGWNENIVFDFLKQSYLMTSGWILDRLGTWDNMDPRTRARAQFFMRQYLDALAPSNFLWSNPEVLKVTIESNGQNLVRGMQNLLQDLQQSSSFLKISTVDHKEFEVGKNIATTPGAVIYENRIMQLIYYQPKTKKQYERPILIIPPCINKFYIFDLKKETSYIQWLLDQGYPVFIISWVNPGKDMAEVNFEDYVVEGPVKAVEVMKKEMGVPSVNVVGYCIGGTMLTAALAYLKKKKRKDIHSATFLATLIDFEKSGELGLFIDDDNLSHLEKNMSEKGYFDGADMHITFSMLRANDMVWSFMINNYLLGKDPFPFDLLYWNSDHTRLPAAMHSYYLRNMYQSNQLIKPGGIQIRGVPITISNIDVPCYFLAAHDDHIAPWQSSYEGMKRLGGKNKTFVLTASGHVAGIVNHPVKEKYGYWVNGKLTQAPQEWFFTSKQHQGSWWEHWHEWCQKHAGKKVEAHSLKQLHHKKIESAPGRYVLVK